MLAFSNGTKRQQVQLLQQHADPPPPAPLRVLSAPAAKELVNILQTLHSAAGFGESVQEFIAADGIPALVKIATTGWPADGCVASSRHMYDKVVNAEVCIYEQSVM